MKEYGENKWSKIIFVGLSLSLFAFGLLAILSRESTVVVFSGIGILALSLYTLINPFVHTIILDENSITEKSLFKSEQIFLPEITHISVDNILAEIKANKRKIKIGKFNIERFDELMGAVISKIKHNEGLLVGGDLIIFQSYVNDSSENKSLTGYDENNLTDFTFVQDAKLLEKRRLFRVVNLTTSKGNFKITYFGKGMGYECVFINDDLVSKQDSHLWYAPKFDFNYKGVNFSVNVKISPWLTIRKFWIEVGGKIIYSE